MYSKAKIGKHPIHPMLVAFPITFYLLTFVSFLIYQTSSADLFWFHMGFFSNYAAILTAVLAAIPGFVDWAFGIPERTEARKHGTIHMILNLVTLAIFTLNAFVIRDSWDTGMVGVGLTLFVTGVGSLILLAAAYWGWEMIGHHKVGVDLTPEQEKLQDDYEKKAA